VKSCRVRFHPSIRLSSKPSVMGIKKNVLPAIDKVVCLSAMIGCLFICGGIDVARLIDRWRERRTTQISTSKNVETRTSSPLTYDYHATQHHAFIFDTRVNVSHSLTQRKQHCSLTTAPLHSFQRNMRLEAPIDCATSSSPACPREGAEC
jgi:hypothetical protein